MEAARALMPEVAMAKSAYEALDGADAMVIATEWDAFRAIDLERVRSLLRTPVIVDLRNVYSSQQVASFGFSYHGIGRN
jgi:UDPglucose 6-dehydrogenase